MDVITECIQISIEGATFLEGKGGRKLNNFVAESWADLPGCDFSNEAKFWSFIRGDSRHAVEVESVPRGSGRRVSKKLTEWNNLIGDKITKSGTASTSDTGLYWYCRRFPFKPPSWESPNGCSGYKPSHVSLPLSSMQRIFCRLGYQIFVLLLLAWLTLWPFIGFFPHISQILDIPNAPLWNAAGY